MTLNCAGSKAKFRFNNVKYPLSMSSALYNQRGKVVSVGNGLKKVGNFEFKKRYWTIFWTLIPLSSTSWIDAKINQIVAKKRGTGVANLRLETTGCKYNGLFLVGGLPFIPGCIHTTVRGDIVR